MTHRPAAPPALLLALFLAPLLTLAPCAAPALARDPTGAERARLEAALRAEGYQDWGRVGLEDGVWTVEGAVAGDGTRRDLRLTPDALRSIATDPENRPAGAEERAEIGAALRHLGYTDFGRVALEDGLWRVARARASDGQDYTLTLEQDSLRILHREDAD
ncbi:hypothetical protein [Teichococcus aestuarii]|uniref:hypothetical protein n=1 Tax=Teichococcus aestuarii TaxID=568898 RepID=UPI003621598C